MLGTPYAAWFLRLLGCQIGRWVFLETTLLSEFDLVKIGDRASLNLGSTIQTHLFEDRSYEVGCGRRSAISARSATWPSYFIARAWATDRSLGPLSVLMKGEVLPSWSRWHGIPSQPMELPGKRDDRQRRKLDEVLLGAGPCRVRTGR